MNLVIVLVCFGIVLGILLATPTTDEKLYGKHFEDEESLKYYLEEEKRVRKQ